MTKLTNSAPARGGQPMYVTPEINVFNLEVENVICNNSPNNGYDDNILDEI